MFPHTQVTERLLRWFEEHGRDLPWRKEYKPYEVWVSEIMLQQTQMDRAVEYFTRWMVRFPDVESVAQASEDEILKYWEGLGYYSRARNLHATAQRIVTKGNGRFPNTVTELEGLPGVGPYTARAVASLAFKEPVPAIDANVERVVARLRCLDQPVKHKESQRAIQESARDMVAVLKPGQAREFNQALMEFGALVCSRNPSCEECPLESMCLSRKAGLEHERPIKGKPKEVVRITMATGVLVHHNRLFIQKRLPGDVWAGLWEFPGGVIEDGESQEQALVREFQEETEMDVVPTWRIGTVRYSYTKYRVTMHGFYCALANGREPEPVLSAASRYEWIEFQDMDKWAFPAGHAKLRTIMQEQGPGVETGE